LPRKPSIRIGSSEAFEHSDVLPRLIVCGVRTCRRHGRGPNVVLRLIVCGVRTCRRHGRGPNARWCGGRPNHSNNDQPGAVLDPPMLAVAVRGCRQRCWLSGENLRSCGFPGLTSSHGLPSELLGITSVGSLRSQRRPRPPEP
jgi:hypothetical protein